MDFRKRSGLYFLKNTNLPKPSDAPFVMNDVAYVVQASATNENGTTISSTTTSTCKQPQPKPCCSSIAMVYETKSMRS